MGFNEKMAEGINATGKFPFVEVNKAITSVANDMGAKAIRVASSDEQEGIIWLEFFTTGMENLNKSFLQSAVEAAKKTKYAGLIACVMLKPGDGGAANITVGITEAMTSRETVMLLPVTPKAVHGLNAYRDFLNRFAPELKRIDPDASVDRK